MQIDKILMQIVPILVTGSAMGLFPLRNGGFTCLQAMFSLKNENLRADSLRGVI